jgi:hypothetical protein
VGQNGLWDVDGMGLKKINDADVASQIVERVNAMNVEGVKKAALIAVPFAILPQSVSSPLVSVSLVFAGKFVETTISFEQSL